MIADVIRWSLDSLGVDTSYTYTRGQVFSRLLCAVAVLRRGCSAPGCSAPGCSAPVCSAPWLFCAGVFCAGVFCTGVFCAVAVLHRGVLRRGVLRRGVLRRGVLQLGAAGNNLFVICDVTAACNYSSKHRKLEVVENPS